MSKCRENIVRCVEIIYSDVIYNIKTSRYEVVGALGKGSSKTSIISSKLVESIMVAR